MTGSMEKSCVEIPSTRPPIIVEVLHAVAADMGVTIDRMLSDDRHGECAHARHVAMYLSYKLCAKSYQQVGRVFRRDHSTIVSAVKKIAASVARDASLSYTVDRIAAAVYRRQRDASPATEPVRHGTGPIDGGPK